MAELLSRNEIVRHQHPTAKTEQVERQETIPDPSSNDLDFIDRDDEGLDFENLLRDLTAKEPTLAEHVLNIWGVGGIGKSRLIKEKFQEIASRLDYQFVLVNFEVDQPMGLARPTSFKACLALIAYKCRTELGLTELKVVEKSLKGEPGEEEEIVQAGILRDSLQNYLKQNRQLVLALDGINQSYTWFVQLEKHLLSALMNQKFFLILGSRTPLQISRFELRMHLRVHPLLPLAEPLNPLPEEPQPSYDPEQDPDKLYAFLISRFAKLAGESPEQYNRKARPQLQRLEKTLNLLSRRHPAALLFLLNAPELNQSLDKTLDFLGIEEAEGQTGESEGQRQLKIGLMKEILERYTFVSSGTLQERKVQLMSAIREMSIYRRFDAVTLQNLADIANYQSENGEIVYPLREKAGEDSFFTAMCRDLVATRVVSWEISRRGYVVEDNYRHIIANGLKAEDDGLFQTRQIRAIQRYLQLLRQQQGEEETKAIYLIELLYHITCLDDTQLSNSYLRALGNYINKTKLPSKTVFSTSNLGKIPTVELPSKSTILRIFANLEPTSLKSEISTKLEPLDKKPFTWLYSIIKN